MIALLVHLVGESGGRLPLPTVSNWSALVDVLSIIGEFFHTATSEQRQRGKLVGPRANLCGAPLLDPLASSEGSMRRLIFRNAIA